MEIPTARKLLRRIERRAFRQEWFDQDAMHQMVLDGSHLWYRHPDSDTIIKVTVEELPLSEWPDLLSE